MYDVIDKRFDQELEATGKALDLSFNAEKEGTDRKIGFLLMVFPINRDIEFGVKFVSNGVRRADLVDVMRSIALEFEGN